MGSDFDLLESGLPRAWIASRAHRTQAFDLLAFQRFVDALDGNGFFFVHDEAVYPDDHRFLAINLLLVFVGRILDFLLHVAALESFDHATQGFNLPQIFVRAGFDLVGQGFDVKGTSQRVDGLWDPRLVGHDLLSAQRNPGSLLCGACNAVRTMLFSGCCAVKVEPAV